MIEEANQHCNTGSLKSYKELLSFATFNYREVTMISINLVDKLMGMVHEGWSWWWESSNPKDQLARAILTLLVATISIFSFLRTFKIARSVTVPLPPGPRGLPIVGYLPFLDANLNQSFAKLAHIYGPILKLQLGNKLYVIVTSPSLAKEIFRDQDITFANRDPPIAASAISNGGADIAWGSYGPNWRMLRKYFRELMNSRNLSCFSLRRTEVQRHVIRDLYTKIGTPINIGELAFLTFLEVVTSMLWGDIEEESSIRVKFQEIAVKFVELLGKPNISDFFPILAPFDIQGVERQMKKVLQRLDQIFDPIIDQRIKLNGVKGERIHNEKGYKDFLQFLLELEEQEDTQRPLTRREMKALFLETILGGIDTTSTTVEWVMTELVQHPEIIRRAQQELDEVVGMNNNIEESHLPKLQYLGAVVKETMRLHPAAPLLIPHCPSLSCMVGGYTIPKGATVIFNMWAMHRNPQVWNNPLEFQPERFLGETSRYDYSGNNFNYLPFGSGRRICPGISLAESMLMFILASLLHSFEWKLPNDIELDFSEKFGIVLKKMVPLVAIPTPRLSNLDLYA